MPGREPIPPWFTHDSGLPPEIQPLKLVGSKPSCRRQAYFSFRYTRKRKDVEETSVSALMNRSVSVEVDFTDIELC